jgi:hypothetical protein
MTSKRTQFVSSRRGGEGVWRRGQNLTVFAPKSKIGPIFSTIIVIGLVAILSLIYLFQITKTTSDSYVLDDIESQKAALTAEREDLRNENARLQAAKVVGESGVSAGMTTPTSIDYAD